MTDVYTVYPYHSVNSVDTWYLVCSKMLVLYLVYPGPLASVFFFVVFPYRFYPYHYRYTEVVLVRHFLSYRFQTIIPKLSVRCPFLLFSCQISYCACIGSAQITPSTYKRESIVLCLQALEMIPDRQFIKSGPTAVGAGGPFLPPSYIVWFNCHIFLPLLLCVLLSCGCWRRSAAACCCCSSSCAGRCTLFGGLVLLIPAFSFSSFKHDTFLIFPLAVLLSHVQPRCTYNPIHNAYPSSSKITGKPAGKAGDSPPRRRLLVDTIKIDGCDGATYRTTGVKDRSMT